MENLFRFADELGPAKIIHVYEPGTGMKGICIVDNVACGPAIGGVRMAPDVSVEECFRLARAMTMKNAAAGLPHGGGKSVLFGDPHMPEREKEPLIRAFANAIRGVKDYIPGPDMGTNERSMGWVRDEIGRAVGLPRAIGGIPLDEIGVTGFGCAVAAEAAEPYSGVAIEGARVAIQGFGAVGTHAARFLAEKGAIIVAVSDSATTLIKPDGLDVEKAIALKREGGKLADYAGGEVRPADAVLDVECEIWLPAARPDVLRADTIDRLKTKLIVQGANIPATLEAEAALAKRGVLSLPDFIANAGGVICASVEYHGGSQAVALDTVREKISRNVGEMLEDVKANGTLPRAAAEALARKRIAEAAGTRRRF